eukprot:3055713-Prymnesium_polylepis.1
MYGCDDGGSTSTATNRGNKGPPSHLQTSQLIGTMELPSISRSHHAASLRWERGFSWCTCPVNGDTGRYPT